MLKENLKRSSFATNFHALNFLHNNSTIDEQKSLVFDSRKDRKFIMGRGKLTGKELEELRRNPYVVEADEGRIIYSNEFKDYFIHEYMDGKKPGEIFRSAGFDVKALGSKRIERASARWRESFFAGTLGSYEYRPGGEGSGGSGVKRRKRKPEAGKGEEKLKATIEEQRKTILKLREELERLRAEEQEEDK